MRELIQAMIKTGGARVTAIVLNILSVKIFATVLGPYGVGLLSMLQQILQTSGMLAAFGGQTAIVQGVARRGGDARSTFLVAALGVMVAGTLFTAFLMIISAPLIAKWLFHTSEASFIHLIQWIAIPLCFTVAMNYLRSLLNGMRAIGRMAMVQVSCAAVLMILAFPTAMFISENGRAWVLVMALSLSSAAGAGLAYHFCLKAGWIKLLAMGFRLGARLTDFKAFLAFAGVMLAHNVITSGALLMIRSLVIQHGGLEAAGVFGAAWSVSINYVTLILSALSAYYLPALSRPRNPAEKIKLIESTARLNIIIMVPLAASVIATKPLIIRLLYAEAFLPSLELMRWMLIGDYLRTTSWCFGMTLIAHARMRVFFWKEAILHLIFLGSAYYAVTIGSSIEWIGVGALIINILNLIFLLLYVARDYQFANPRLLVLGWLTGLGVVLTASWITWEDLSISWPKTICIVAAALIHNLLFILAVRKGASHKRHLTQ